MTEPAARPGPPAAASRRRLPGIIPWTEIRAVYEGTDIPLDILAKAYAIHPSDIYPHAEREGWMLRRERWAIERKNRRTPAGLVPHYDRAELVQRLFRAVERQIGEIERRAEAVDPPAPDEKDARTLGALARTLDLLISMEKASGDKPETAERGDLDELRRELTRRIEGLRSSS
jgi:hypothetical protein